MTYSCTVIHRTCLLIDLIRCVNLCLFKPPLVYVSIYFIVQLKGKSAGGGRQKLQLKCAINPRVLFTVSGCFDPRCSSGSPPLLISKAPHTASLHLFEGSHLCTAPKKSVAFLYVALVVPVTAAGPKPFRVHQRSPLRSQAQC